ncbi:RHS repeat-associated core domain-containing protein [Pseudomonas putida]|uniref:RHS repeat-associated core domain-containing protein n=1 Tax=Pseudomonas putida TaxID=303 RepID=UPI0018A943DC|nr:RHS repeat-associated core domain-containing protein [Pseudomonas putida]MBF8669181.1 RHS repeat-associated core domain-containing protein [Pseudomonas putida]MBF8712069.1 RHS repeat-associated core domain-containing protein [Pseudomonas putida]
MSKASNNSLFFYQGDKLITVKQGDQHRAIFRHHAMPLAEQQRGTSESVGLLVTDDKGSILSVQDADKNEPHALTAYGHDPGLPSPKTLLGFNGERTASVSKNYPLGKGYRNYSPCTMRFTSSDALSPFGAGGLNAYAYCLGDPVNRIDPSGHISFFSLVKRIIFQNNLKQMRGLITGTHGKIIAVKPNTKLPEALGDKPTLSVTPNAVWPENADTRPISAFNNRSRSPSTSSYDSDSFASEMTPSAPTNNLSHHVAASIRSRDDGHGYHDPYAPR